MEQNSTSGAGGADGATSGPGGADGPRGSLSARIRARLPELRETEARVARAVLEQGAGLVHLSVSDVAALAGTASSTVVRTCQRLGFRGFQELKLQAARQAPEPPPPLVDEPAAHALAATLRASREALDGVAATLDTGALAAAAEALHTASRVVVVGAGLSGAVALDVAYRLRALGCQVDAPPDPLTAQLAAAQLPPDGVCLAISHTGATRTTVDTARRARAAGASVVTLTSYARSPLSETSSQVLVAGGQDLVFGLETSASRIAHLAAVDALTHLLMGLRPETARRHLDLSADITADHAY
ncbi:SIS domain-containing protein [Streptomyces sp. SID8366]|uniref:MurR/RpiR family transcriptional regulator n=1 Tax=unclassified Streptomyces TaxID=2593676 RepID=UPI000DB926B9|nr:MULTISPECIES: MurR/RpiR family transcriptional regulator [unclassified Streptomyces]MYU08368.1 SIS domain-containing protein [Streptomyces sp. SID8366]MYU67058.1 SIS domain-containing protein [Streptomyces sp. SID69]RAJ62747.1 RpiR family transcriptional regulator [Streptomyces sp. PsTaAH-130]